MARLIFDLTTSCYWAGPPVGIVRVERQLARLAFQDATPIVFSVFNQATKRFGRLPTEVALAVIEGKAGLQLPKPAARPQRSLLAKLLRQPRKSFVRVLREPRKSLVASQRRLAAALLKSIDAQGRLIPQHPSVPPQCHRYPFLDVVTEPLSLAQSDTMFSCGHDWMNKDIFAIRDLKCRDKFRYVGFCHDVIPWKFPQYYSINSQSVFVSYLAELSRFADKVLVLSECVRRDYLEFCAHFMTSRPSIAKTSLPHWPAPDAEPETDQVAALAGTPFVLFVSTIEPRKNHRLAYLVWERLVAQDEIPSDVRLVFAGRFGWEGQPPNELVYEIRQNRTVRDRIVLIEKASDAEISWLYRNCLFTIFPSAYEGYGLPAVESLRHGKVCVAAAEGALPEVLGGQGVLLDPFDLPSWRRTLSELINDRGLLEARSAQITPPTAQADEDLAAAFRALVMS